MNYFISFYAWNTASREIEFQLKTEEGQVLESAKHLIRKPIDFGNFIHYANLTVEES